MSIYQAPQVPQPAVTFGGGNYVDLSTVNMLQGAKRCSAAGKRCSEKCEPVSTAAKGESAL